MHKFTLSRALYTLYIVQCKWCPFIIVNTFHYCENSPFTGKRMGRHINAKHQYQTAFISIKNVCGQKFVSGS